MKCEKCQAKVKVIKTVNGSSILINPNKEYYWVKVKGTQLYEPAYSYQGHNQTCRKSKGY